MAILAAPALLSSCGREATALAGKPQTRPLEPAGASANAGARGPLVVFLGDSLTAGYGVPLDAAFPARVAERLAAEGRPIRAVNAGVSGDSSAGGVRRLDWILRQKPELVVVELGGNDGLRGLDLRETEANLRTILTRAQAEGAATLLLGMRLPPSLGADYVRGFEALFPRVAAATASEFIPFFLDGVGGVADLNQADGIHPTTEGHRRAAANVAPFVRRLLDRLPSERKPAETRSH